MSVVAAASLRRTYKGGGGIVEASLSIAPGEIVGIQGPSGTGKSTLLRLLSAVERPDRGTLTYAGAPAWGRRRSPSYPRPGYLMPIYQDPAGSLDPRWPIWRTITEPLTVHSSLSAADRRERARGLLASAGMDHIDIAARPGELSGGQCQRVAILRAIVARPALILADEPTARQDVITAAVMTQELRRVAASGVALAIVSHNGPWLATLADRVLSMTDGRLTEGGPVVSSAPGGGARRA